MDKKIQKESLKAWEKNATFWDEQMGDYSNDFHNQVVKPKVTSLLNIKKGDYILDVACGNGNYAAYMASQGAQVVAFDFSKKMIALAKKRHQNESDIEFCVADATNPKELKKLQKMGPYDKMVSNMAIVGIATIQPLFDFAYQSLKKGGYFVFSTQHPCFVTLTNQYKTFHYYQGEAIANQPCLQYYYHRSLQDLFHVCFQSGFVIDGFEESYYKQKEIPEIIIVRAKKE